MKRKAFTLIEVIVSITIFFVLLVVIVGLYTKMARLKYNIQARQSLIQNSYDAMEKINLLLKDYSIDYEEYFNRWNVGCVGHNSDATFSWNIGTTGHCTDFTAYGNRNNIPSADTTLHKLYYCSSLNPVASDPFYVVNNVSTSPRNGCLLTGQQSFGQYYRQGRDTKTDVDTNPSAVGDGDDRNMFQLPDGISLPNNVQELYLISPDKKQRVFIRRALIESGDRNRDQSVSGDSEYLYTLQILKLRGFDAGDHHDFDINTSSGVYDGNTDTRACDYAQGFICHGSGVGPLYSGYALPLNNDDGRVNLFDQDLTVSKRNIVAYPTKNPEYALSQNETQINPYFTLSLTNKLYGKIWFKKLGIPSLEDFQLTLQTSFSTKTWYTK